MEWEQLLSVQRTRASKLDKAAEDMRSEFSRDYDRLVFSTPVRRLQDKTQVFPLDSHDAIRTRLTHSIEVSTVARDLARNVCVQLIKESKINQEQGYIIETIAATCGLMHDIGNPPFGHAGEKAISGWFAKNKKEVLDCLEGIPDVASDEQLKNDFLNFEGNAQMFRLITKLQVFSDYYGLNLTYGTLSASCKYVAASNTRNKAKQELSKPGYFASEAELINNIRKITNTGTSRNPIAFLVEAADDIVYASVDIEDGLKKGVVKWTPLQEQMRNYCEEFQKTKEFKTSFEEYEKKINTIIDGAVDVSDIQPQALRTAIMSLLVPSVTKCFINKCDLIMKGEYHGELIKDCDYSPLLLACKKVGANSIYGSQDNLKLELMGRKVICDLLDIFWEGVYECTPNTEPDTRSFQGKIYSLISKNYRSVFNNSWQHGKLPRRYYRLQLITDYICGMTDTFACSLRRQLVGD